MKHDPGLVEQSRDAQIAGLHFERVKLAVTVGVEPLADRIARKGGRLLVLRKVAAVGVDTAGFPGRGFGQGETRFSPGGGIKRERGAAPLGRDSPLEEFLCLSLN